MQSFDTLSTTCNHEVQPARFGSSVPFRHSNWSISELSNDPEFLKVGRFPIRARHLPINLNLHRRHPFLGKRQDEQVCRYVCSPNACGGASCNIGGNAASEKRDEDTSEFGEDGFYNGTSFESDLTKRKLNAVTPRGIGRYVSFRNGGLGDLDKLCPVLGATRDQPTYCIERTFAHAFTDGGQFRMGTADTLLTGCTILVVVSARAAYMVSLLVFDCCSS